MEAIASRCNFWTCVAHAAFSEARQVRGNLAPCCEEIPISWVGASEPCSTLNTDGSVNMATNQAASEGVLCDNMSNCVAAFANNLGSCSITRAELNRVVEGMQLAWSMGVRHLEVQVDSQCAIYILSKSVDQTNSHAILVERFMELMALPWIVRLKHVYLEGNHVANAMANPSIGLALYPFI
ncbi:Putative ribonuclease H protein At1g65750 [Linum grandiflorum]